MSTNDPVPGDPVTLVQVRPFTPADHTAVFDLAPRLTVGIAPWLGREAALGAARGGLDDSIAGIGSDRAVCVAANVEGRCVWES